MSTPRLLSPKKIKIRTYVGLNRTEMLKLIRAHKSKKYGFMEVAYDVEDCGQSYNVHMEYTTK